MLLYVIILILADFYAWPVAVIVIAWFGLIITTIYSLVVWIKKLFNL